MCVSASNVQVRDDSGFADTNDNGYYTVYGLNTGRYQLRAYPCPGRSLSAILLPRLVRVTAPRDTEHVSAVVPAPGRLTGTVLGGSPVTTQADVCVQATQVNGSSHSETLTSQTGRYSVDGLSPGYYRVRFDDPGCSYGDPGLAPQWYRNVPVEGRAELVKVVSGGATAVKPVTLRSDGAIRGTVTQQGHGALSGVCVIAKQTGPVAGLPVYAVTGSAGRYSIIDLPPGTYRVQFSSGCGATGYLAQWWNDKSGSASATPVTITAGTTTSGISAVMAK
jgi:hypothetical protein